MIDVKGTPVSFVVSGDRAHSFAMPRDLGMLPEKVAAAYQRVVDAQTAEQKASGKNALDYTAKKAANDKVRDAVHDLYDVAASTAKAAQQSYGEAYEYAMRRYERAVADAQGALQAVATAAALYDQAVHGHAVGMNPTSTAKAVMTARVLSESLGTLPVLPELEA